MAFFSLVEQCKNENEMATSSNKIMDFGSPLLFIKFLIWRSSVPGMVKWFARLVYAFNILMQTACDCFYYDSIKLTPMPTLFGTMNKPSRILENHFIACARAATFVV